MLGIGLGVTAIQQGSGLVDDGGAGLPEGALAYADLKNGTYFYQGNTLDDFLAANEAWGSYDISMVVAGTGLKSPDGNNIGPVFAAGLTTDILATGFSIVARYNITTSSPDSQTGLSFAVMDIDTFSPAWFYNAYTINSDIVYVRFAVLGEGGFDIRTPSTQAQGQHSAGITFDSSGTSGTIVEGGDTASSDATLSGTPNTIGITIGGDAVLESFAIYVPPKTLAELEALSA
jgi:hypothetical protein